jgi:hypothetical protein
MMRRASLIVAALIVTASGWGHTTAQPRSRNGEWQRAPASRWSTSPPANDSSSQTAQPGRRVVAARSGSPITEQLLPDDKEVEIVRIQHFLVEGFDDPDEELEFLTRHAEAAVTVEAVAVSARLTPERDWIQSELRATIIDVLKNASRFNLQPRTTLLLQFEGGELEIGGKRVKAVSSPARHPTVGRQYLYFLFESSDRLVPMPAVHTFELVGNSVRRLYVNGQWGLDKGVAQDLVLNSVRSMSSLPTVRAPRTQP